MKSTLVFVIACLLYAAPAQLYASDADDPLADWGTIVREAGAGLGGGVLGGIGGVCVGGIAGLAFSHDISDMTWEGIVLMGTGLVAGISLGTATGTWAVGQARNQGGRWGPTLLGALAGTAAGAAVVVSTGPPVALIGALLPTTGAVVGYNLSRPGPEPDESFLSRLDFPSVALLPSGRKPAPPSLDVRLLNVRFWPDRPSRPAPGPPSARAVSGGRGTATHVGLETAVYRARPEVRSHRSRAPRERFVSPWRTGPPELKRLSVVSTRTASSRSV